MFSKDNNVNSNYQNDGILYLNDNSEIICFPPKLNKTNFLVPLSITLIESYVFSFCDMLETLMIPSAINQIKSNIFNKCKNLKTIIITSDFIIIQNEAFLHCSNLEYKYYCSYETPLVALDAFEECDKLKTIFTTEKYQSEYFGRFEVKKRNVFEKNFSISS